MTQARPKKGLLIALLILVVLIIAVSSATYVVHQNEYGVVYQFGAVVDVKESPGLYFKIPFVQTTSALPKTKLLYDLPISDVITADKHSESRINAIVYNALKTVISSQNQEAIISGRDGAVVRLVMENIGSSFERYGIEMLAVETKTLDLPDDNKSAVYTRMISERNNIAASYTAEGEAEAKRIRNEADKQVEITLSKAKSEAETVKAAGDAE